MKTDRITSLLAITLFIASLWLMPEPQPANGQVIQPYIVNSNRLRGTIEVPISSGSFISDTTSVSDKAWSSSKTSAELGGKLGTSETAVDSDKLGGIAASGYAVASHNHDTSYLRTNEVIAGTNIGVTANPNGTITIDSTGADLSAFKDTSTIRWDTSENAAYPSLVQSYSLSNHNHDLIYLAIGGKAADSSLLNGVADSTVATASTIVKRDANSDITTRRFISGVATGTSPFSVASTTVNTNLNADLLDGKNATDFLGATATASDSSKLGGVLPSGYLTVNGTAYDSDRFGGYTPEQTTALFDAMYLRTNEILAGTNVTVDVDPILGTVTINSTGGSGSITTAAFKDTDTITWNTSATELYANVVRKIKDQVIAGLNIVITDNLNDTITINAPNHAADFVKAGSRISVAETATGEVTISAQCMITSEVLAGENITIEDVGNGSIRVNSQAGWATNEITTVALKDTGSIAWSTTEAAAYPSVKKTFIPSNVLAGTNVTVHDNEDGSVTVNSSYVDTGIHTDAFIDTQTIKWSTTESKVRANLAESYLPEKNPVAKGSVAIENPDYKIRSGAILANWVTGPSVPGSGDYMAMACGSNGRVYMTRFDGTGGGSAYRSSDGGSSWTQITNLPDSEVIPHSVVADNSGVVMIGGPASGGGVTAKLYRSTNNGDTWSVIYTGYGKWNTAATDRNGVFVFGSDSDGTVIASLDSGASFAYSNTLTGYPFNNISSNNNGSFIVSAFHSDSTPNLHLSTNSGSSWSSVGPSSTYGYIAHASGTTWFYTGASSQYISNDNFSSWSVVSTDAQTVIDSDHNGTLYSASASSGVCMSSDSGATWSHVDEVASTAAYTPQGIAVNPYGAVVFASSSYSTIYFRTATVIDGLEFIAPNFYFKDLVSAASKSMQVDPATGKITYTDNAGANTGVYIDSPTVTWDTTESTVIANTVSHLTEEVLAGTNVSIEDNGDGTITVNSSGINSSTMKDSSTVKWTTSETEATAYLPVDYLPKEKGLISKSTFVGSYDNAIKGGQQTNNPVELGTLPGTGSYAAFDWGSGETAFFVYGEFNTASGYISTNKGQTWTAFTPVSGQGDFIPVDVMADDGGVVILCGRDAATDNTNVVFRSDDNGSTWNPIIVPVSGHYRAGATDRAGTFMIVDYVTGSVMRSTDYGITWSYVYELTASEHYYDLATDSAGTWITVGSGKICKSYDNGTTWEEQTASISDAWVSYVGNNLGAKTWIVCNTSAALISADNGGTWDALTCPIGGPIASDGLGAVYSAKNPSTGVYKSMDFGYTWVKEPWTSDSYIKGDHGIAVNWDGSLLVVLADNTIHYSKQTAVKGILIDAPKVALGNLKYVPGNPVQVDTTTGRLSYSVAPINDSGTSENQAYSSSKVAADFAAIHHTHTANDLPPNLLNTGEVIAGDNINVTDNGDGTVTIDNIVIDDSSTSLGKAWSASKVGSELNNRSLITHNHDSTYLGLHAKADDSDKLDGIDSTGFATSSHLHTGVYLPVEGKAADSDLLDGINPGHASGDIPISDGTLNANLNAEKLDGHASSYFSPANHLHDGTYLRTSEVIGRNGVTVTAEGNSIVVEATDSTGSKRNIIDKMKTALLHISLNDTAAITVETTATIYDTDNFIIGSGNWAGNILKYSGKRPIASDIRQIYNFSGTCDVPIEHAAIRSPYIRGLLGLNENDAYTVKNYDPEYTEETRIVRVPYFNNYKISSDGNYHLFGARGFDSVSSVVYTSNNNFEGYKILPCNGGSFYMSNSGRFITGERQISRDFGATLNTLPTTNYCSSIYIDESGYKLAASSGDSVEISLDGGNHFTEFEPSFLNGNSAWQFDVNAGGNLWTLVVEVFGDDTRYINFSVDNWQNSYAPTGLPDLDTYDLTMTEVYSSSDGSVIVLGLGSGPSEQTNGIGVWRSVDYGHSFTNEVVADVESINISPDGINVVYAATDGKAYKSDDGGDNFYLLDAAPENAYRVFCLGESRWATFSYKYGSLSNALYFSDNKGETFYKPTTNNGNIDGTKRAVYQSYSVADNGKTVASIKEFDWAEPYGSWLKISSDGSSFTIPGTGAGEINGTNGVYVVSISRDASHIIAGTTYHSDENYKVWYSSDGGSSFQQSASGTGEVNEYNNSARAADISDDGSKVVIAASFGSDLSSQYGIWVSNNGGASFSMPDLSGINATFRDWYDVSVSGDGTKIVAVAYNGRLWLSSDGGSTWSTPDIGSGGDRHWICCDISKDGQIIVAGTDINLWVSRDSGVTFYCPEPPNDVVSYWFDVAIANDGATIVAGSSIYDVSYVGSYWLSKDGGITFEKPAAWGNPLGLNSMNEAFTNIAFQGNLLHVASKRREFELNYYEGFLHNQPTVGNLADLSFYQDVTSTTSVILDLKTDIHGLSAKCNVDYKIKLTGSGFSSEVRLW